MKLGISIYLLLFIFTISAAKCRNCGLVVDTSAQIDEEKFLTDTLHILHTGEIGSIEKFIESNDEPYSAVTIIRIGDRQAWIQSTLNIAKRILEEYDNISLAFLFLDTDSSLAEQMYNTIVDRFNTKKFKVLYTQSYTESESIAKIPRWKLQTTPAIIIFSKSNNYIIYPMTLDEKDILNKINAITRFKISR